MITNCQKWQILFVRTNHEKKVTDFLDYEGITCYLPTILSRRIWSDRTKWLKLPLFPGYLFAKIPTGIYGSILSHSSIIELVKLEGRVVELSDNQVNFIRDLEMMMSENEGKLEEFRTGDRVRIIGGPLSGSTGRVDGKRHSGFLTIIAEGFNNPPRLMIASNLVSTV